MRHLRVRRAGHGYRPSMASTAPTRDDTDRDARFSRPVDAPNGARRMTTAGLGAPVPVPHGSVRDRIRSKPGLREVYRVGVFVVGLLFMAIGVALMALPGPLTIPPVLLGLYIWSTEFAFAKRFFDAFKRKADEAWAHAKAHPVSSTAVTAGGLVAAGVAFWAVNHFGLVEQAKTALL
jgi:uncharacterized protein (TIGR02611 family)